MSNTYSTLALIHCISNTEIAIASISVTTDECVISGAWLLPLDDISQVKLVLANRRILILNDCNLENDLVTSLNLVTITLRDFFKEARSDVDVAVGIYENYKALEPKKRKNLVRPNFFEWPIEVDLASSTSKLEEIGMTGIIQGTDPKFRKVLAGARLTKFYIDKWQSDENERSSRKYVDGAQALTTILPTVWLN